jgi:hypothetical protein
MTTPAQAQGIIKDVTQLRYTGPNSSHKSFTWILSTDDGSNCPYFRTVGGEHSMCEWLKNFEVIQTPVEVAQFPDTPAGRMGIKVGDVVRMKERETKNFCEGVLIRLVKDDDSRVPYFERIDNGMKRYVDLDHVELMEAVPAQQPAPVVPTNNQLMSMIQVDIHAIAASIRSPIQQAALDTFNTMRTRAIACRANDGMTVDDNLFYTGYGICDNIHRCTPNGVNSDTMALIKDNIIRQVPSYSGNYHYPVNHPDEVGKEAAESAWNRFNNKWKGIYGANRLQQLEELIHHIEHKWDESLAKEMTPAQRVGLIVDVTVVQYKDGSLWKFTRDDRSSDPYFTSMATGNQTSLDLRYIEVLPMDMEETNSLSVAEFLQRIEETVKTKADLEAQVKALQLQIAEAASRVVMLDYNLATTHKVKRIV